MPPDDLTPHATRRNSFGENDRPETAADVEHLKKLARQEAARFGLDYGPNKINRLVCGYLTRPPHQRTLSPEDYLRLTYADPVGEGVWRKLDLPSSTA